mgnify:CR=1 FL=1
MKVVIDTNVIVSVALGSQTCKEAILKILEKYEWGLLGDSVERIVRIQYRLWFWRYFPGKRKHAFL